MLHTASLLIDDIEDNSLLRRGRPVAHSIYRVAQTINSANYFYFCAMKEIEKLGNQDATKHVVNELLQLHRGQGMDLHWRESLTCPTEEEYIGMIRNKTGGLFRLAIKLMETQSSKPNLPEYRRLADLLGILFQIRDDYQNLCSKEYTKTKGYCEDLTEGKFSFPIIHSICHDPSDLTLFNILRQKPTDPDVKRCALACLEQTGSFEYTREFIRKLIKDAGSLVEDISASIAPTRAIQVVNQAASAGII
ncbi:hypothetical protein NLG97_g3018 [Lecanicillium saksenae]|uniref:Uncharacterized protein n=1 Tax=Lecanicillium saksenae TaxID=468837 RepID=A0ACC1QZH6_9HYPO|nr:hypothetical protein NLG97_g3018 [Lecanicillium saksenae]